MAAETRCTILVEARTGKAGSTGGGPFGTAGAVGSAGGGVVGSAGGGASYAGAGSISLRDDEQWIHVPWRTQYSPASRRCGRHVGCACVDVGRRAPEFLVILHHLALPPVPAPAASDIGEKARCAAWREEWRVQASRRAGSGRTVTRSTLTHARNSSSSINSLVFSSLNDAAVPTHGIRGVGAAGAGGAGG